MGEVSDPACARSVSGMCAVAAGRLVTSAVGVVPGRVVSRVGDPTVGVVPWGNDRFIYLAALEETGFAWFLVAVK